jgi:hypothetical protein
MQIEAYAAESIRSLNKQLRKANKRRCEIWGSHRSADEILSPLACFTLKIKTQRSIETSVTIYQSTRRNIPGELNVQEVVLQLLTADLKGHCFSIKYLRIHQRASKLENILGFI